MVLEIGHHDLTNRARTSFTSVGSEADSPEPLVKPSPATGHEAEKLDLSDQDLGYDLEWKGETPATVVISMIAFECPIPQAEGVSS
jgi:hypothetical protein